MLTLGILLLLVAAAALVFYLRTSYSTQGGSLGQVPCVAAAAIQVPLLTILGLGFVGKATTQLDFAWWQWFLVWLVETLCIAAVAAGIGRLAERRAGNGSAGSP